MTYTPHARDESRRTIISPKCPTYTVRALNRHHTTCTCTLCPRFSSARLHCSVSAVGARRRVCVSSVRAWRVYTRIAITWCCTAYTCSGDRFTGTHCGPRDVEKRVNTYTGIVVNERSKGLLYPRGFIHRRSVQPFRSSRGPTPRHAPVPVYDKCTRASEPPRRVTVGAARESTWCGGARAFPRLRQAVIIRSRVADGAAWRGVHTLFVVIGFENRSLRPPPCFALKKCHFRVFECRTVPVQ